MHDLVDECNVTCYCACFIITLQVAQHESEISRLSKLNIMINLKCKGNPFTLIFFT